MDDIRLFTKKEKEQETIAQAVRIYSQDIWMEIVTEKSALQILKSGKRHMTDRTELPNQ